MATKKVPYQADNGRTHELRALVSLARAAAYKRTHARILLMSDEERPDGGMTDTDIASRARCGAGCG